MKSLSKKFKQVHQGIEWQDITNLRNIAAHNYDGLRMEDIWEIVTEDIPELLELVKGILRDGGVDEEFGGDVAGHLDVFLEGRLVFGAGRANGGATCHEQAGCGDGGKEEPPHFHDPCLVMSRVRFQSWLRLRSLRRSMKE